MLSNHIIWILEDNADCRFVYDQSLGIRYNLKYFSTLSELRAELKDAKSTAVRPNLVLADLWLPDGCFLNLLSSDDRSLLKAPFLVVSSMDDIDALRFCYQEGALDYLVKPFKKNELIVKIEHALASTREAVLKHDEHFADLTYKEQQILRLFLGAKGREISRTLIFEQVWQNVKVDPKTLDVHLYNLRRKLQELGFEIKSSGPGKWTLCSSDGVDQELSGRAPR